MEKLRREELKVLLREGRISLVPSPQKHNWPSDPLISMLRVVVEYEVSNFVDKIKPVLDQQDLKYQTLFRLTALKPPELFVNGDALEKYLISSGVYTDWRNMSSLNQIFMSQFEPRKEVIISAIEEQYEIIVERLSRSGLPLKKILKPSGISAEQNWYIHKTNGSLLVAQGRESFEKDSAIFLEIHKVDVHYANMLFRDLHYIHTPRAQAAIGLFVAGEDIPFSVVGVSPVDRRYKKDALLMCGYNPEKCWEVVRLYSSPGAPMNTSSTMLSQAVKYIKTSDPEAEACISAFTPSFADGRSMLAGGFGEPIIAKPLTLTFGDAQIGPEIKYERLTSRRFEGYAGVTMKNSLPLLPTLELVRAIRKPQMQPLIGQKQMIIMHNHATLESL